MDRSQARDNATVDNVATNCGEQTGALYRGLTLSVSYIYIYIYIYICVCVRVCVRVYVCE